MAEYRGKHSDLHGRGRRVFTNTFRILELTPVAVDADCGSLKERRATAIRLLVQVLDLANELNVSVKTIETHQMRMKDKLGVHTAAELRQKAREWLARSAMNRIREVPKR